VGVKFLKVIVVILVVVAGLFIGGGYLLPQKVSIERSAVVESDPSTVFEYVNNLEKYHSWSPWADMDPNMQLEFSGPERGVGASMSWASEVPQVGNGSQKIVVSEQDKRVIVALEFNGRSGGEAEFELVP